MVPFKIRSNLQSQKGFSLPELLVSIGIITLVTTTLLVRYSAFNSTTLLNNQAYEVALDVRQTQVAGISVRGDGSSNQFEEEYGIYFDTSTDGQYIFFRDNGDAENVAYNSGEEFEIMNLDTRFRVAGICANDASLSCSGGTSLERMTIFFRRPNFDAHFNGHNISVPGGINSASIALEPVSNSGGAYRLVNISATGQISVIKP